MSDDIKPLAPELVDQLREVNHVENAEQLIGQKVRLLASVGTKGDPPKMSIPAGAVGTISGYKDGYFEVMFWEGADQLELTVNMLFAMTEPVEDGAVQ